MTLSGSTLTWEVPSLAVGEQAEVSYAVLINADAYDAQLRNVATPSADGACVESCSTEHTTSTAPTPPGPTPPGPTPPGPAPEPPTTPSPIPPTGAAGVLGLAALSLALVIGGGLLVRRRRGGRA